MASSVSDKMVYDVDFVLSFMSDGDTHDNPPLEFKRDVTIYGEAEKKLGTLGAIRDYLEMFFAGINDFPREYVSVGIRNYQIRSA